MADISRRNVSGVLLAGLAGLPVRRAAAQVPPDNTAAAEARMIDAAREFNAEPQGFAETGARRRDGFYREWSLTPAANRMAVGWEDTPARSAEYGHLVTQPPDAPFTLTAAVLKRYVQANAFELRSVQESPLTVFGLRGGRAQSEAGSFVGQITVQSMTPDHQSMRCLIGIWDRRDDRLCAFRGSTVPNADEMAAQVFFAQCHAAQQKECFDAVRDMKAPVPSIANMRPTGLYRYVVNWHSTPNLAVPSCLIDAEPSFPRRSYDDLTFTVGDWSREPALVGDNVHPAFLDQVRPHGIEYSSAGCHVIGGHYIGGKPVRDWAAFQKLFGPPSDGQRIDYLLATGRELAALSLPTDTLPRVLRFGSSGVAVAQLRRALGLGEHNAAGLPIFDAATAQALVAKQRTENWPTFGLLDSAQASKLAVKLD